jgi:response regulator NasT
MKLLHEMQIMDIKDTRPTIVLADDQAELLNRVSQLLAPGYNILAMAKNGLLAVEAVLKYRPDVAILDIKMPVLDGFKAAQEIRQKSCKTRIVFLTFCDDNDCIAWALYTGVLGYVLKSLMHSDLIPAIEHALADRIFVSSHRLRPRH